LIASLTVAAFVVIVGIYQAIDNTYQEDRKQVFMWIGDFKDIVEAFTIVMFGFGVHAVLPTLEYSMETPSDFPLVSNISFTIITELYVLVAIAGYAGFANALSSCGILSSLSSVYQDSTVFDVLVKIVIALLTLHLILTFPIPMNPINLNIESIFGTSKLDPKKEVVTRVMLRTVLMLLVVFVASVVPYLSDIISILSSIAGAAVAFILPCIFYYVLNRENYVPIPKWQIALQAGTVLLGLAVGVAGTYLGVDSLVTDIKNNSSPFDQFFVNCNQTNPCS